MHKFVITSLILLFISCKTTPLQWELVPIIDCVSNGETYITSVIYNSDIYEFYSDTKLHDSCYVVFDNGKIVNARG